MESRIFFNYERMPMRKMTSIIPQKRIMSAQIM